MTNNLFKNLLSLAVVASMAFLYSCGDDEETLPSLPTISATADASMYDFGATAMIDIDVTAPGELSGVNWTVTINDVANDKVFNSPADLGLIDTETGLQSTGVDIALTDEDVSGASFSIEFEVVDKSNQTATSIVEFSVGESSPPASENVAVLLGGQLNATTGSFYNIVDNEVYNYATTRDTESANVDFVFFRGSDDGSANAIAALDDENAGISFDAALSSTGTLSEDVIETRNATRFKILADDVDAAAFDAIVTVADLQNAVGTDIAPADTRVSQLAVDDVFGFQFAEARGATLGIVKIVSIEGTTGTDRTITFDVKFEQPM